MPVEQIRVGKDNFSYLVFCEISQKAGLVDPGFNVDAALDMISDKELLLEYIINTHHHGDHTAENRKLKEETDARIVASEIDSPMIRSGVDIKVKDGDKMLIGEIEIEFIITPGHTEGGMCLIVDGIFLITGDTLFIGDCGRCDLPGGDLTAMFWSLQRIKELPDELIIYPGHDYGSKTRDILGNQKKKSPVLRARNLKEFSKIR